MGASARARATSGRLWPRVAAAFGRTAAVVRHIIGVPDYERYATHMRTCHPDQPVLSCEEFTTQRLADRYSRPGSRCC